MEMSTFSVGVLGIPIMFQAVSWFVIMGIDTPKFLIAI
jgi:hypothetical protein